MFFALTGHGTEPADPRSWHRTESTTRPRSATITHVVTDGRTMFRRNLKRTIRYPGLTIFVVFIPVVFLLLFVFVFGGALGAGIRARRRPAGLPRVRGARHPAGHDRGQLMGGTAIGVSMDMHEGIVARFRSMSISRGAVLAGHVSAASSRALIALILVLGIALLIGFRPTAAPADWLLLIGVLVLICSRWSGWRSAWACRPSRSRRRATCRCRSCCCPSSARLRADRLDARVAAGLRGVAAVHPVHRDGARSAARHRRSASYGWLAVGWCVVLIAVVGYVWSMTIYERKSVVS